MTVEVRLLQAGDDVQAAGALIQAAYFRLPGYPRDEEYDLILAAVGDRSADADIVVALVDGRIVGCLTYVGDHSNPHAEFDDPFAASFRYFGVEPSVQGSGIGSAMVEWCIARARNEGKRHLRIHTLESMPAAQRLYASLGFRRDPSNDEDWDGIKGIAYVYDLRA